MLTTRFKINYSIGAIANGNIHGKWITVQDYANMELEQALKKAFAIKDVLYNEW